jgi:archaellum component FlaG (FlaF/FlaG flagellin family)
MQFIKAHLFDSLEQAQEAIDVINQGEGIPINKTATTRTYTQPQENNGQVYIQADEVTIKYLSTPINFEIIETNINEYIK